MRKLALILAALGTGLSSIAMAEDMYRWQENGKTYYGDQPPVNRQVETIDPKVPSARQPAEEVGDDRQAQVDKVRSQECDKARARLVEYQNSPTLKQRNLKGEERELTASERIDVIVRAQTDVNELCGEADETENFSGEPVDDAFDQPVSDAGDS